MANNPTEEQVVEGIIKALKSVSGSVSLTDEQARHIFNELNPVIQELLMEEYRRGYNQGQVDANDTLECI